MSKAEKLKGTNPFCNVDFDSLPVAAKTDYHKDGDDYIIEYEDVEHVEMIGDKDTDFVITKTVEVSSKVNRQEYLNSYADDVGIMNILEKVRRTGDESLFNQRSRVSIDSHEKDSLGRPVEDIVDITSYQIDRMEALNKFKSGAISFSQLPEDLRGKLSMSEVAHLSDEDIDKYLDAVKKTIIASRTSGKEEIKDESSK